MSRFPLFGRASQRQAENQKSNYAWQARINSADAGASAFGRMSASPATTKE
jgi:hypothetical protein